MASKALLFIGVALAFCAACTEPSKGAPSSDDAGPPDADAASMSDDAGDDRSGDAGLPPDDGPWPAPHYPMPQFQNLGGGVLASPKIVTVTFAGAGDRDALRTFDDALGTSAWWSTALAGYGVGPGSGGLYAEMPDTVSGRTLDSATDVAPMVASWFSSGALPTPDANTVYVVYFPVSTTILQGPLRSCVDYHGYHASTPVTLDAGSLVVPFAIVPDCNAGLGDVTFVSSHEVAEMATDPYVGVRLSWYGIDDAWWGAGTATASPGGELADVCEFAGPFLDVNGNSFARIWNNRAAAASHDPCQPEPPSEIFYSVAVPTQTVESMAQGMSYPSDGYVVMKAGTTKTLDAVVFSEAMLPSDVTVLVGAASPGTSALASVPAGITATLSRANGHNGVHVKLALNVESTTAPGDYSFVVRAFLSLTDRHDWPVMVKVK